MKATIPIIILHSSETKWSFVLKRKQFPIHVCYAMTINKSQEQSLKCVRVYLLKSVLSHGQLNYSITGDFTGGFESYHLT